MKMSQKPICICVCVHVCASVCIKVFGSEPAFIYYCLENSLLSATHRSETITYHKNIYVIKN